MDIMKWPAIIAGAWLLAMRAYLPEDGPLTLVQCGVLVATAAAMLGANMAIVGVALRRRGR